MTDNTNNVEMLVDQEVLLDKSKPQDFLFLRAANYGEIESLLREGYTCSYNIVNYFVVNGYLDVVSLFYQYGLKSTYSAFLSCRNFDLLTFLNKHHHYVVKGEINGLIIDDELIQDFSEKYPAFLEWYYITYLNR